MGALTVERNTPAREGEVFDFPVAAGVRCLAGGLIALDGGYAKPGTAASGLVAVGRCEATVDNTGVAGTVSVPVRRGVFRFANSTGAGEIAQADVGTDAYIADDQTVSKTASGSRAGRVVAVDTAGVWVQVGIGY